MTRPTGPDPLTVDLAFVGIAAADLGRQLKAAMQSVMRAFARLMPTAGRMLLADQRARYGGNGSDAFEYPEAWQSTVCGAWLCRAGEPCPSTGHDLRCTCRCHTGQGGVW